jgi:acyl-CoA reductase-like NAD-dependent aldehyde dehydrogenase
MKITNPANGKTIAEVVEDTPASVADSYGRARRAQPAWARTPFAERLAALRRFRDLLVTRRETLALTLTREMGKPIAQARNELAATPGRLDFFLAETERVLADEVVLRDGQDPVPKLEERITHEPLGIVGNISAWNYPYFVGTNVFVPALLTGNAVLYKPSELTSLTGQAIGDLLHEAGVPEDVFTTLVGGAAAGAALLEQPVDGLFFTGSYATGRRIAETVAPRLTKIQLELGGKDPTYVCEDADPKAAAASLADGAFYNTGQSCCSVERLYVHERIAGAFIEAFVEEVRGFVVGEPEDEKTYIGPLARPAQLAVLEAQVRDALEKGGRLLLGGARLPRPGAYFAPTVIVDARNDMRLMREESFGPIIGIATVGGDEEALRLINDTEYGLTAGVYTRDRARAERLLAAVDAGSVYWNCCDRVSPRLPWTGRRHSGLGSTLSHHGIRAFLQPKAWHLRAPSH